MSTTPRNTVASAHARIDALDAKLDRILAVLDPAAVAKPAKAPAKARKAAKPKASAKPVTAKALCKATRLAFIAAAKAEGTDFAHMSTKAIAAMCIEEPALVPAGFRIGEGYAALLG